MHPSGGSTSVNASAVGPESKERFHLRVNGIVHIAVLPFLVSGKCCFELDCVLDFTEAEYD